MRPLSPVEAAVGVAVAGSLLAAAVPAFVRNLRASRLAEPIDGLGRIAGAAAALAAARPVASAYPDTVGLTPARVPQGRMQADPRGTWDHPTWKALEFELNVPHWFAFGFESRNAPEESIYRARAHGDLDGDGALSTFELRGAVRPGRDPVTEPLEIFREVE